MKNTFNNAWYIEALSECWVVNCYGDDDIFAARQENFYLNSEFIHPNSVCPSRRDLSLPFSCACPAKKMQVTSPGFLALEVPVSSEAEAGRKKFHSDVC